MSINIDELERLVLAAREQGDDCNEEGNELDAWLNENCLALVRHLKTREDVLDAAHDVMSTYRRWHRYGSSDCEVELNAKCVVLDRALDALTGKDASK